jgi:FkbM family methyltransferase
LGLRFKRPALRTLKAVGDVANIRSFFLTMLCLKAWANVKLGVRTPSKEIMLDLKRLKLCIDVASVELISYWEIWHEFCYDSIAIERPRCVVDVGANIGAFALYQAIVKHADHVIAFEPSPHVFPRLAKNMKNNNLLNVRLVNAAVGEKEGVLSFSEGKMSINGQVSEFGPLKVPCVTLDAALAGEPIIDILKIDAEGYETHILKGASETLQKTRRVALELHYPGEREEIDSLLLPHGFSLVKMTNNLAFYSNI